MEEQPKYTHKMCQNLLDNIFPSRIYKRLARRRNRLAELIELEAPDFIINREKELIAQSEKRLNRVIGDG